MTTVPGRSFEIVYPGGDFEIDASGQHAPPAVGDTIRRNGKLWRVVTRNSGPPVIVRVERADEDQALLRLRFPDGTVEIRWNGSHPPAVGAVVPSRGSLWRVVGHAEETVFLEEAASTERRTNGRVPKLEPDGADPVPLDTFAEDPTERG